MRILIVGAGSGGEQVASILSSRGTEFELVGFLDDNPKKHHTTVFGKPVLGPISEIFPLYSNKQFDATVVSIAASQPVRRQLFEKIKKEHIPFVNVIHSKAYVDPTARIGEGNVIDAFVKIGTGARLEDNNHVSSYANLEHHLSLGSHNTFGPHCSTSGNVSIGNNCIFGTGIFIEPNLKIGDDVKLASGSIVITDLNSGSAIKTRYRLSNLK